MKEAIKVVVIIVISFALFSCSSSKESSDSGISVFRDLDVIEVDKSLSDIEIKIPPQELNKFWSHQISYDNLNIENFSLSSNPKKTKVIWSGFRPGYKYRNVFSPVVAEDKIYLLDAKGNLSARNLSDYKKLWRNKIISRKDVKNFTVGKISYYENKIFATSGYNLLVAANANDGEVIWSKSLASIPISAPLADQNQLYVITNDNKAYSLDAGSGEIIWVHSGILKNTGILGAANPVFYKNYVIISYSSGEIYLLDKKTGEAIWSFDLNLHRAINSDFILNDIDATPIVKDGMVYAVGNGGLMMAISINNGKILWQKELATITDFWIADDFIYLINNDNQLICLYSKTGGIKWFVQLKKYKKDNKPTSKITYNGIIMAGNNLILSNSNRQTLLISPLNGDIIKKIRTNQNIYHKALVVNNKLYLHTIGRFNVSLLTME